VFRVSSLEILAKTDEYHKTKVETRSKPSRRPNSEMAAEEKAVKSHLSKGDGAKAAHGAERRRSSNVDARQYGKGNGSANSLRESVFEAVLDVHQLINEAEGYLGKKSPNGFFQRRYFVAKGHYLKYFKYENEASNIDYCLAAIDVKLVTITDPYAEKTAFGTAKEKCMFDIVFPDGEKKVLKAERGEGAKQWVEALTKMKEAPLPLQEAGLSDSDELAKAESDDDVDGDAEVSYAEIQEQTKATLEAASLVTTRALRSNTLRKKSSLESKYDTKALKPKSGEVFCLLSGVFLHYSLFHSLKLLLKFLMLICSLITISSVNPVYICFF